MRKWIGALALVASLTLVAGASAVKLKFPFFEESRTAAKLSLNGDADTTGAKQGHRLRLAEAGFDTVGTAFTKRKLLWMKRSFKSKFRFEMHDSPGNPADGMAFVLTSGPKTSLGGHGGGLGYAGIERSVAVEFDIFDNGSEPGSDDEPSENEVSVHLNGNSLAGLGNETPSFSLYGGVRFVWIQYAARTKRLKVFVDDDASKPGRPLLSERRNLKRVIGRKARAGFAGSTGGDSADIDVLSWTLKQRRPRR